MGESPEKVLDDLGLERYCCRRMVVSHADLIDEVSPLG
ncbi:MAG: DNA-directed RNA polymerase subunit N [Candidatus Methanomethylophilaceae archaeon]|nr:DNA-directed RNA polymerase subunit N [Candidatus Methanomethylophilaceae archaeon]